MRKLLSLLWSRQFLVLLFFVALSATFWLFTALNEDYRDEIAIPVQIVNVPENTVITTDAPEHVYFTVRDKGATLLVYRYLRHFNPILIDFNAYPGVLGHVSIPTSDLMKQVSTQLYSSTQLSLLRPQQVEFYYNDGDRKRVPIKVVGTFKPKATDCYISQLRYTPDSVTVFAPRNILDTITTAYTTRLFLTDLADTTHLQAALQDVPGAKFSPDKVSLTIIADRLIEKKVSVPVRQYCFPAGKQLRTFPSRVEITFQTGMSLYQRITADDFHLMVSYEDLLGSPSRCHLTLKSVPPGVRHVQISPADVDFVIEDIPISETGE